MQFGRNVVSNFGEPSALALQNAVEASRDSVVKTYTKPHSIIPPYLISQVSAAEKTVLEEQGFGLWDKEGWKEFRGQVKAHLKGHAETLAKATGLATATVVGEKWGKQHKDEADILIVNANNLERMTGVKVRSNYKKYIHDLSRVSTNETKLSQLGMDNERDTWKLLYEVFGYRSFDGKNSLMKLIEHFGWKVNNAFWSEEDKAMACGDGDRRMFENFIKFKDVIGHEIGHGVISDRLRYENEAGALNEHLADVIGILVHQYKLKCDVRKAVGLKAWLVGFGLIKDSSGRPQALRSFIEPGTAYWDDPQMKKYSERYKGTDDEGGVHINSGIPNYAFYSFANALYNFADSDKKTDYLFAWGPAGKIWFDTLMTGVKHDAITIPNFAAATLESAKKLYKDDTQLLTALVNAWKEVGIDISKLMK